MICKKDFDIFLLGSFVGMVFGVFLTPKSGKEMRRIFFHKLKDLDEDFMKMIKELEEDICCFDQEKNLKEAKRKADELMKKTDCLVKSASKKNNSALKEIADDIQRKASIVTETVLDNLE